MQRFKQFLEMWFSDSKAVKNNPAPSDGIGPPQARNTPGKAKGKSAGGPAGGMMGMPAMNKK